MFRLCALRARVRGDNQDFDGGNGFNVDNGADSDNGPFNLDDDDPTDTNGFRLASLTHARVYARYL